MRRYSIHQLQRELRGQVDILCNDCGHLVAVHKWLVHRRWHRRQAPTESRATVADVQRWLQEQS